MKIISFFIIIFYNYLIFLIKELEFELNSLQSTSRCTRNNKMRDPNIQKIRDVTSAIIKGEYIISLK